MNATPGYPCRRAGCTFQREVRALRDGTSRRDRTCSRECRTWLLRARRALQDGNAAEAAELLHLATLLDGRKNPTEFVPGVYVEKRRTFDAAPE